MEVHIIEKEFQFTCWDTEPASDPASVATEPVGEVASSVAL